MKASLSILGVLIVVAVACTDEHPARRSSLVTAPGGPALTLKTLPANASTVCVASVRKRDQLLAKTPTANHAALDAAIEDICQ
jgi:hypothetical protein